MPSEHERKIDSLEDKARQSLNVALVLAEINQWSRKWAESPLLPPLRGTNRGEMFRFRPPGFDGHLCSLA
jgi:hypothetical protein